MGHSEKSVPSRATTSEFTKMKILITFVLAIAASVSCHHLSTEEFVDGISGFFEIDHDLHAPGQHDDWHGVEIIWNQNKGAFTWQNRAGVTWTLTPLMGSSGDWDESKLAVGNDCPYKNDGHEFAMIEWGSLEGSEVVTTIWGPWNEPYLRDLQGTPFVFDGNHDPIAALANKPEPTCTTKIRKIREQRDEELEDTRFEREEEMANVRLERGTEIANITAQERDDLETIRTEKTEELQRVLAQQEQCEGEGEGVEATCRTQWNEQIEETRAEYEGQKETVREERDVELEHIRQSLDRELSNITSEMTTRYDAIQQSREQQLERLREEREEECAAAGFEAECTDRFDDQIEDARIAMEAELERQARLDALREEWRVSCTDRCTVCRENMEELLEAVHLEFEEKITLARIHWDEQV